MYMKKIFSILVTLTLLVTGCDDTNQSAKQTSLPTVDVLKIKAQNVPLSFSFTARAQGYKETEVRARVGGILLKRNYKEGSEVVEIDSDRVSKFDVIQSIKSYGGIFSLPSTSKVISFQMFSSSSNPPIILIK